MNPFGKRTDEELAEILYGKPEPKHPPAEREAEPETEPEVEEDKEVDWELEETPDGKGLKPKAGIGGMLAGDDRLMKFLEDDIEAMEKAAEDEERRIEENRRKL